MKKFILLAISLVVMTSCGVQRPYPPTIETLTGSPATQYGTNNEYYAYGVSAYSLYEVTLGWDVSNTGAQGVKVIIATDYNCDNEVISKMIPTACQTDDSCVPLNYGGGYNKTLAHVFQGQDISSLIMGQYYVCVCSVMFDSISSPSLPVSLYLLANQYGTAY